jgi:hypothetical protein
MAPAAAKVRNFSEISSIEMNFLWTVALFALLAVAELAVRVCAPRKQPHLDLLLHLLWQKVSLRERV